MACLIDKRVVNPHYKKIHPDTYWSVDYQKPDFFIPVDCGVCRNCLHKKMSGWRFRLIQEVRYMNKIEIDNSYFCTFTIESHFYNEDKKVIKRYFRRFLERCRKRYKFSPRHFFTTEYGENTDRLHLHGILFNPNFPPNIVYDLWKYGFVSIRPLRCTNLYGQPIPISQTISYCTTYLLKAMPQSIILPDKKYVPIVFTSPGMGKAYAEHNRFVHHQKSLIPFVPTEIGMQSLPRYLRGKIFTDEERETLKNDYFDNYYDDVIPDGPYFIGSQQFNDYTVWLKECKKYKLIYNNLYGKHYRASTGHVPTGAETLELG